MHGFVQNIGRTALNFLAAFGRITLFSITAVRWIFTPPYYWQQLLRQIIDIGYFSLPVVGLTTLFSGWFWPAILYRLCPLFGRRHGRNGGCAIGHSRIRAGIGRIDGCWSDWRLNGCRNWHDAGHGSD
jgi:ABC-type transporter Mla maintaining outer membrane lipid asymmetry permease subunit MlaE